MNKFWTVLSHTYTNKIRSRSFIISTIILILALNVVMHISDIMKSFTHDGHEKIAVLDQTKDTYGLLAKQIKAMDNNISVESFTKNEASAKKAAANGDIDGYLIIQNGQDGLPEATFKAKDLTNSDTITALNRAMQQVKMMEATQKLGIDPQKLAKVYAPVTFHKEALNKDSKTEAEMGSAMTLVYLVNLILYISILTFGMMIAMEIATEKSSRVMEIIISSVSPVTQMMGKIIGVGLLGITQYIVLFAAVYGVNKFIGSGDQGGTDEMVFGAVKNIPISLAVYAIVFFLLGYFLYATLFATIGSLINRVEETNQAVTPVTMLAVAAFMVSIFGLNSPDSTFITVMSFVPFFTPVIMFLRVGLLEVPIWQVLTGIGINVVCIAILIWVGISVYKGGVLLYSSGSVLKSMRKAIKLR